MASFTDTYFRYKKRAKPSLVYGEMNLYSLQCYAEARDFFYEIRGFKVVWELVALIKFKDLFNYEYYIDKADKFLNHSLWRSHSDEPQDQFYFMSADESEKAFVELEQTIAKDIRRGYLTIPKDIKEFIDALYAPLICVATVHECEEIAWDEVEPLDDFSMDSFMDTYHDMMEDNFLMSLVADIQTHELANSQVSSHANPLTHELTNSHVSQPPNMLTHELTNSHVSPLALTQVSSHANPLTHELTIKRVGEQANPRVGVLADKRVGKQANSRTLMSVNSHVGKQANSRTRQPTNSHVGKPTIKRVGKPPNMLSCGLTIKRVSFHANSQTHELAISLTRRLTNSHAGRHKIKRVGKLADKPFSRHKIKRVGRPTNSQASSHANSRVSKLADKRVLWLVIFMSCKDNSPPG
jgi:hypothetical protein